MLGESLDEYPDSRSNLFRLRSSLMSYDLSFIPKLANQSWDEARDAAEEAAQFEATMPPDARAWELITDATQHILGEISTHVGRDFYELDHEPTGIQVTLFSNEAGITAPYWYRGDDAEKVVRIMYRIGLAIESATGLSGYDPQLVLPIAEAALDTGLAVQAFDQAASIFKQAET